MAAYSGPVWSRAEAVRVWKAGRAAQKAAAVGAKGIADGSALVFDGDPRTTLAAETLVDSSPAVAFTGAYVTRPLRGITVTGGLYTLAGPWVQILDLEPPDTAPSTTTDGQWTATRGDNAFNDAMTYFHIDQSQRYLQSLGYSGLTGIQYGPLQVDTDGLSGADNSWYIPSANELAFGHGGVDDNEDADVILHEYGHAITYDIVPTWGGGDSGAIGEGYGDYWGASYSYTTTNGATFHPTWVFKWDGHSADTWTGRFLDMTDLTYNPAHTYVAHETIGGIPNYSDQLWSTPLFQAFLTLLGLGCTRAEVDRVVTEAFFGVGAHPTMRDMAIATVNTAALLYPSGPHGVVFREKFAAQGILPPDSDAPSSLAAIPLGRSRIDLSWVKNPSNHNVLVAWNTSAAFGIPTTTYASGDAIAGGGTVLYNGSATLVSHTGLSGATTYFYKAWSVVGAATYSVGVSASATTVRGVPFSEGFENGGEIPDG